MANAASLAILAAVGAALALAGSGEDGEPANGGRLGAGVAIRISAPDPARTLPSALDTGDPMLAPVIAEPLRRTWSAVERAGSDPAELLGPLSALAISVERSCPPPALLACRPGARVSGLLRVEPDPTFERDLTTAVVAGLRASGIRRLVVHGPRGDFGGRVSSHGETLARWRRDGELIELATGGLELRADHPSALAPPASTDQATPGSAGLQIEVEPATLAALLR